MNTYIYQIMIEEPHPNGIPHQELVSRLVFTGDAVLLAKVNQAVANAVMEWKSTDNNS